MNILFASLIAGITLTSITVSAAPIKLNYSGTVSSLTFADCLTYSSSGSCNSWSFSNISATDFVAGNLISVGNRFNGSFAYDPVSPLTAISADGYQAVHLHSVPDAAFSAAQLHLPSGYLPQSGYGSFSVVNGRYGYDSFFLQALFSGTDFFASVNLHLQDSTGTVFTGFDVPRTLDFSDFNAGVFNVGMLRRSDGDQVQLYGTLNSVSVAMPVPEPTTAFLTLVGLGAVSLTRRSRGRHSRGASPRLHAAHEL